MAQRSRFLNRERVLARLSRVPKALAEQAERDLEREVDEMVAAMKRAGFVLRVPATPDFIAATRVLPFEHVSSGYPVDVVLAGPGLEETFLERSQVVSLGKVRIEKQLTTPFNQRFSALTECSALTFTPPSSPGFSMPGSARVFLMKESLLELYGNVPPTGSPLITLQRAAAVDNVRFFSTEQRGGFVHVQYQGEVNIDGWAKASDLTPLPRGETSDVPPSSYSMSTPPELQLPQPPRTVKTTREIPLRLAAKDAEAPIGVIEAETEVYVMDTVAGWANVLPKSLHVLPAGEQPFWVKSADLGL